MRALEALCSWHTLLVVLISVDVLGTKSAASHPEWRRHNSPRHWPSLRSTESGVTDNAPKRHEGLQPPSSPHSPTSESAKESSRHPYHEERSGMPPDRAEVVILVPPPSRLSSGRANSPRATEESRTFLSVSSNIVDYSDYKPGVIGFLPAIDHRSDDPFFRRSSLHDDNHQSDSNSDRVASPRSFTDVIQRREGPRAFPPDHIPRHHHHADNGKQYEPRVENPPALPKYRRVRIPVRALVRGGVGASSSPRRRDPHAPSSANQIPSHDDRSSTETRLITLHSPTRIFIPVRLRADNTLLATPDHKECVQCPANQTLIPGRGENCVQVPVPAVSVCSYLARVRGRVNVAVTSGPRPGSMIPEGDYPIEVIVWKNGGHVYSCQYGLTVKVQKCPSIEVPEGGAVDCSNGTTWGSTCRFTCEPDFVLRGHHSITCEGNEQRVAWTAAIPKCKSKRTAASSPHPCTEPLIPPNGTFVCDAPNQGGLYRDGAVCQYFCFPGYQMIPEQKNNEMIVCKRGTWNPTVDIRCSATHCPRLRSPPQGSVRCHSSPYTADPPKKGEQEEWLKNGTSCEFRCQVGYVIPTSQLPLHLISCHAPVWNTSATPDCKRAVPPRHHPDDCRNETLTIESGEGRARVSFPRFTSGTGRSLTPTCALGESLPTGLHLNFCEATDPELRVTTTCSYHIVVRERLVPRPHRDDCSNQTVKATRRGTAVLKIPRFFSGSGRSLLPVTCTYSGQVGVGDYLNHCSAKDSEFNSTGNCTYSIVVKERACPAPPEIEHASVKCRPASSLFHPRTVCEYVCHEGYVIPTSQKKTRKRKCLPKLKWSTSAVPSCRKAVPPRPHSQDCKNQTLFVRTGKKVRIKPPRFKSVYKPQSVGVQCSLPSALTVGSYNNFCEAQDKELRVSASCSYSITVKARYCLSPDPIKNGNVECDTGKPDRYRVSTVCRYVCQQGFVIPTDQLHLEARNCTSQRQWNVTHVPTCVQTIPPQPTGSTCKNRVLITDDPFITVEPAEFISSSGVLLPSNCTPENVSQYGAHNITCESYDPQIRESAICFFLIDIQADNGIAQLDTEECSAPPSISNGNTECTPAQLISYRMETECQYVCHEEYVIPTSQLSLVTWKCVSGGEWNSTLPPTCVEKTVPQPIGSTCSDRVLANDSSSFLVEPPDFRSSSDAHLPVNCTPSEVPGYGLHNITCEAYDPELRISATCVFSVDFQAPTRTEEEDIPTRGCPLPPMVKNSDLLCNSSQTVFPELTLCEYVCQTGYFIPNGQLSVIICSQEWQWNATEIPVCKAQPPRATADGCEDHSVHTLDPRSVSIPFPEFVTTLNQSAQVTCSPREVTAYGEHDVTCTAVDLQSGSESICTFRIIVSRMESTSDTNDVTGAEEPTELEARSKDCPPLLSPTNGHVICTSGLVSRCNVSCEEGFSFPSAHKFLQVGYVQCNSSEGIWDFQKNHDLDEIPDCLGELSTTSLQTWLKFKMAVENCNETFIAFLQSEIKGRLMAMHHNVCKEVDCTMFHFNCTEDADRNRDAIEVRWTLKASFFPQDYEFYDEVPKVETQIETILETTQRAVTTEPELLQQELQGLGLELWQDSYRQGLFSLVCQRRGFVVDLRTDKCVQCPSGFVEVSGKCEQCPADHYQEKTGQTNCTPCPDGTRSAIGSRSSSECRG